VTCGWPSGRTVAIQYTSASARCRRPSSQGTAMAVASLNPGSSVVVGAAVTGSTPGRGR
jgi:hypothetical protein